MMLPYCTSCVEAFTADGMDEMACFWSLGWLRIILFGMRLHTICICVFLSLAFYLADACLLERHEPGFYLVELSLG